MYFYSVTLGYKLLATFTDTLAINSMYFVICLVLDMAVKYQLTCTSHLFIPVEDLYIYSTLTK